MVSIDGILANHLSLLEVCFFVHGIGAVMLLLYILLRKGERLHLGGAPLYVYFVGLMGVALVTSSSYCANRVGAALTILAAGFVVPLLPYLLSFAAGAMVYVVVEELIPEMSEGKHSNVGTVLFAAGFTVMMALDVALG